MMVLFLALSAALLALPGQAPPPSAVSLHAPWEALLRAHVRGGLVDYDALERSPEFPKYLQALSAARLEGRSKDDQLAFWINAYNAYTIELINKHHERDSIRNINKLLGLISTKGPWSEPIVRAAGRLLTLDEVEHNIIRREFKEPRIHMALVCAAMSCPPLRYEAYEGANLDQQLHDQTRIFLRERSSANQLDLLTQTLRLSKIFDWYRSDFGAGERALQTFVAPYFPGEAEQAALASKKLKIQFTEYEWGLNIQNQGRKK